MSQLTIKDLSLYQEEFSETKTLGGGSWNPIPPIFTRLEKLDVSVRVGVSSRVLSRFPDTAGTAFVAVAAVGAGQGAFTFIDRNIFVSS
jgi:hypothetical protein